MKKWLSDYLFWDGLNIIIVILSPFAQFLSPRPVFTVYIIYLIAWICSRISHSLLEKRYLACRLLADHLLHGEKKSH
jgi:hypothetical protein